MDINGNLQFVVLPTKLFMGQLKESYMKTITSYIVGLKLNSRTFRLYAKTRLNFWKLYSQKLPQFTWA